MPNKNETHKMHRSRMRERIISSGSENLCDHELLEVLLYYSIPRKDTNALAHALIDHFGSIDKLFRASETELVSVSGIGEYSAVLLKTVFELHSRLNTASAKDKVFGTFEEIGEYFVKLFAGCDVEKCVLILFDKKGRIDRKVVISEGTADVAPVKMKKIIASSVSASAVSAALAHNHPSGVLLPSFQDKNITLETDELLRSLEIRFIDHYIVASDNYIGVKRYCYGVTDSYSQLTEKDL